MNHKGYLGVLRVDEEAGVLRGKVVNTRDTITFQGKTFEEASRAFRDSVDDYLEFCESLGQQPEKPFSGKFVVRVRPELHRTINAIAQAKGISVNRLVAIQLMKLARRTEGQMTCKAPSKIARPRKLAAISKDATKEAKKGVPSNK
jgi:predicted HicB family RNase H-like nuclease